MVVMTAAVLAQAWKTLTHAQTPISFAEHGH